MLEQFWQDNVTEKSFLELQNLAKRYEFILIGGWAIYLYSRKMKSKDIDIVIQYDELNKLKKDYEVFKNERLNKYEINMGEFDIDIYLPHYSKIGFDLEKMENYCQVIDGFTVPKVEILLILKLYAYKDRKNSVKGQKDKVDIISLLESVDIDWKLFKNFDKNFILQKEIKEILNTQRVDELGIGDQKMAKLREEVEARLLS